MKDIKNWIDSGADINYSNHLGFTALMAGAKAGDIELVKLLVNSGAHINLKDNKHFCALHYATSNNHLNIIKYLVSNGAVVNDTIYMTSIHKNYKDITSYFDSLDVTKQILNSTSC